MTLIRLLLFLNAFAIHSALYLSKEREEGESLIHKKFLRDRSWFSQLCRYLRKFYITVLFFIDCPWYIFAAGAPWNPRSTKENYSRWMRTAYFNLHFNLLSPVLHCTRGVTQVQSFYGPARLTQLGQQPRFVRPGRDHYYRSSMSRLV